jgi:hypothetical protein
MVRRMDPAGGSRIRRAVIYFGVAMTGLVAFGTWVAFATKDGNAEGWLVAALFFCLFIVFGTVVNMFRVLLIYRCPKGRTWIARVPGATPGDPVLYRRSACNVDWDTGWEVGDSGD